MRERERLKEQKCLSVGVYVCEREKERERKREMECWRCIHENALALPFRIA